MRKAEFLSALRRALRGLPQRDIDGHVGFFEEIINDRVEDGLSEEQAVRSLGGVTKVSSQIIAQTPITTILKEKVRGGGFGFLGITLIILGSPIWIALLAAAFAVVVSLYAVVFSLVVTIWAVEISFIVGAVGGVGFGAFLIFGNSATAGLLLIGMALVIGGLSIFMLYGCKGATKGALWLITRSMLGIKNLFLGRRI